MNSVSIIQVPNKLFKQYATERYVWPNGAKIAINTRRSQWPSDVKYINSSGASKWLYSSSSESSSSLAWRRLHFCPSVYIT